MPEKQMKEKSDLNARLRVARKEVEIRESQLELRRLEYEEKMISSLLEARNTVVDDDLISGRWFLIGQGGGVFGTDQYSYQEMLESAQRLYYTNPHARAIVRNLVKFVLGKGPSITFDQKKYKKKVREIWDDFVVRNRVSKKEKEWATRLFRDGEFFLRKFIDGTDGGMKIRFIRAGAIANPKDRTFDGKTENVTFGIGTDPDDVEEVINYYQIDSTGNLKVVIPADEVIHEKIHADSDQKRGLSTLVVCAKRIKQYDDWLEDRIALNKIRSAIALIRKVPGSAQTVKKIRDENLSDDLSETRKKQKAFQRATVITASQGIEYEMLSPNINATDVKDDGRALLLSIAAAVGFPEMLLTADYANSNYSSSLIAQNPFVREIEEWQDFFREFYERLVADVLQAKIDAGQLPDDTEKMCRVEFPPMLRDDVDKLARAFEILFKYKIVSKKTWRGKMGLDDEAETANIENEDGSELYPPGISPQPGKPPPSGQSGNQQGSPFNVPVAPVNQYGAELIEAVRNRDYAAMDAICDKIDQWEKEQEEAEE